jgi:hypothetical protein
VSDVKTVDMSTEDGEVFWRNFRLFCLGEIPAWRQPKAKPAPRDDGENGTSAEAGATGVVRDAVTA